VQFEALFIGMMLDSARSATLGNGLFDGGETQQYLELMDRQVALDMARGGGLGFGKLLLEQLAPRSAAPPPGFSKVGPGPVPRADVPRHDPSAVPAAPLPNSQSAAAVAGTPEEFVAQLLPEASQAAAALGVEPRLLLAQAALETGWGAAVPEREGGESAHNLFGVKAGASWQGARIAHWTTEHEGGAARSQREEFRAYASTAASFDDYVRLIATAPRYANALANAKDPEAYAREVTAAGYATDPDYANKWLAIYHGERLDGALRGAELAAPADD
jgi:flagellar protein FlgJ